MKYIVVLLVLCAGCAANVVSDIADYEMSRYAAIEGWEQVVGPVTRKCRLETAEYEVIEVEEAGEHLKKKVKPGNRILGWMYTRTRTIYITTKGRSALEKMDTAVHEYIHALGACILYTTDGYHENEELWDRHGPDTVEAVGCAQY